MGNRTPWLCIFLALIFMSLRVGSEVSSIIDTPSSDESSGESSVLAEPEGNPDWHTLRVIKITMICSVFVGTLGASILPWWFHRSKWAMNAINLGCCLAAGIIVGLALSHMFGEAQESFEKYFEIVGPVGLMRPEDVEYPFGALVAGTTLFLLMLVDNLVTAHAHVHGHSHGHSHCDKKQLIHQEVQTEEAEESCPCPGPSGSCRDFAVTDLRHRAFGGQDIRRMCIEPDVCPPMLCSNPPLSPTCPPPTPAILAGNSNPIPISGIEDSAPVINVSVEARKEASVERGSRDQVARAWVFCAALSLHSLFDGLSVGAEQETKAVVAFVIAVVSHKFFDGFVVGVALYLARLPLRHTAAALIFCAAMTPLGIGVGWAATAATEGAALQLTRAFILSISLGTFLFIGLVELIPQGLADGRWRPLKCVLCLVGFLLMALIAIWV